VFFSLTSWELWLLVFVVMVVSFLVLGTFDLDRPIRGLITIPATPLLAEKETMNLPPAAPAPR
jgi:hypothetical protein